MQENQLRTDTPLGRDFWLFRLGQMISALGDASASIALAWWVLDKTGSPLQMAAILSPAMAVRTCLLPLIGPLGDRLPRKYLVVSSDLWRAGTMGTIAFLAHIGLFNLPCLITLYILTGLGTSLSWATAGSMVIQLVPPTAVADALRKTQALQAATTMAGGLVGGLVVSVAGVEGALTFNSVSFLLAGTLSCLIKADTSPGKTTPRGDRRMGLHRWYLDLRSGARALASNRILLGIAAYGTMLNFFLAPLSVTLPVLVKQGKSLPPWFLGGLESSIGVGALVGTILLGLAYRRLLQDRTIVLGVMAIGIGVASLPYLPTTALPMLAMFVVGVGSTFANTPIMTQVALTLPDHFRTRVTSLMAFFFQLAAPIGIFMASGLSKYIGIPSTFAVMGIGAVILAPLLLQISGMRLYFRRHHSESMITLLQPDDEVA